jgi:hypothetical protein
MSAYAYEDDDDAQQLRQELDAVKAERDAMKVELAKATGKGALSQADFDARVAACQSAEELSSFLSTHGLKAEEY